MIAVSSTGWSPTLATLLLVMSTTLQLFLLPTVQASVVSGIVRQMWRPSVDSNSGLTKDGSTLVAGRLGAHDWSPEALLCLDSIEVQGPTDANVTFEMCMMYQAFWLDGSSACKGLYCKDYCRNLAGHSFCTADQSAALLKDLRDEIDGNAETCKKWANWIPPMDSLPQITSESLKCTQTLGNEDDVGNCIADVVKKFSPDNSTTIDQLTELRCKTFFAEEKCNIDGVCKYCPSANELLSLKAQFWTPAKVECTKWSDDKPKYECPANIPTVGPVTPSLPGKTSSSPASACESKIEEKGVKCDAEALEKYPGDKKNPEIGCKFAYYLADCAVKAGCKYCTDSETKEPFDVLRKTLDASREGCKQWSSDEPKVECPSNTLMIVGIIIGVIVLLVAIGVAVYCLCFSSDKSAGPSSNAGSGGGSRASSKVNSGKAGSTMGSKQQSRIEAKQSSRA